jgi:hypothetical protein
MPTLFIISISSIILLGIFLFYVFKDKHPYQPDEINGTSIEIVVGSYFIIFLSVIYVIYYLTPIEYKPIVKQYIGYLFVLLTMIFLVIMGSGTRETK